VGAGKFNAWADTGGRIENRFSKEQLLSQSMITLVNDAVISALWLYHGSGLEEGPQQRIDLPAM
jgi:microsomal epoxide hydrolase